MKCPYHNDVEMVETTMHRYVDHIHYECENDMSITIDKSGTIFKACELTLSNGSVYLIEIKIAAHLQRTIISLRLANLYEDVVVDVPYEIPLPITETSLNKILLLL